MKDEFTKLQKKIIKEWEKVEIAHPSFGEIADKLQCSKSSVHKTVTKYESLKSSYHA